MKKLLDYLLTNKVSFVYDYTTDTNVEAVTIRKVSAELLELIIALAKSESLALNFEDGLVVTK